MKEKNIYENDFYAILWMENFSPFAVEVIFPTTFFHDKDFAFFSTQHKDFYAFLKFKFLL